MVMLVLKQIVELNFVGTCFNQETETYIPDIP